MSEPLLIDRSRIRRNGGTQPRAETQAAVVADYAEALSNGVVFPPVVVFFDGTDYWLADGFHRDGAHEALGIPQIQCEVRTGTQRDAVLYAVGANEAHGLRRSNEDKRRAVLLLLDDVEWRAWSDSEIARRCRVSHTFVAKLRPLTCNVSSERTYVTKHGSTATMDAAAIGKRAADYATLKAADPAALYRVVQENHAARQAAKKARRGEREVALGERIAAGNAALEAAAAAGKSYGVIYADPEWRFEPYSRETGMDRAADNHYPTSPTEVIASRPVKSVAAADCVLFLWATAPMLPDALRVMAAWGFAYKSHAVWLKDSIGTGYWFRNQHELLLVGTRGSVPAPAMGTQFRSALAYAATEHSAKPPFAHEIAEAYFPNLPKIEMNAREAREGWDLWGAEAPEGAPAIIGLDLASEPDRTGLVVVEPGGEVTFIGDAPEPAPEPPRKGQKSRAAPKRASWQVERDERDARIDAIAADLPEDSVVLTAAYGMAIDDYHVAVMGEAADDAFALRERMEAILFRANGCTGFGVGSNDAPTAIRRANWAPCGDVPKWGQVGQFIVEHRDVRAIICFGDHEGIHAVDFNRPFPSSTGFHSVGATREPGMSVVDYGKAMLDAAIEYRPDGKKGPARKLMLPEAAYRLERDERGYLISRRRGVWVDPSAAPDGLDLEALDALALRWREDDRARFIEGKKSKRTLPQSLHANNKIIAVHGALLTPLADFPVEGAYVVSDGEWRGQERVEGWRYVADAAALDVAPLADLPNFLNSRGEP